MDMGRAQLGRHEVLQTQLVITGMKDSMSER